MKVMKLATAVLLMLTLSHPALAKKSNDDFLNTRSVDRANQYVVEPGTRVVAGNPLEDEFYILGAAPRTAAAPKPVVRVAESKKSIHSASRHTSNKRIATNQIKKHAHTAAKNKPAARIAANKFKKHKHQTVATGVKSSKARSLKSKTTIAVNRGGHNHIEVTG